MAEIIREELEGSSGPVKSPGAVSTVAAMGYSAGQAIKDIALSSNAFIGAQNLTPASGMLAVAGMIGSYGEAQAQKAAAIQQQTSYMLQARDNLTVAQVRAEMSDQYAQIQAGRLLKKAEIEARNYQIAGNVLLKNLRSTNATMRARAAAAGISFGEGSAAAIQAENVRNVMMDVDVLELNGLTAQVLGFEDATAMIQSTEYQNFLNVFAAQRQAGQYEQAGKAARQQGGLLAGATLSRGAVDVGRTFLSSGTQKARE